MKKVIVVYVPVIHQGYLNLFARFPDADVLLITTQLIETLDTEKAKRMPRHLSAVDPMVIAQMLSCTYGSRVFSLLTSLSQLSSYDELIMPDEDLNLIIEKQVTKKIIWDTSYLRNDWTKAMAVKSVVVDYEITEDACAKLFIREATEYAKRSSDWWRQVAAIVVRDGEELLRAYNVHTPDPQIVNVFGDIRSNLDAGQMPEICTAHHAEIDIVCVAADRGIKLHGADLYVTTFPCPRCARSIVRSGIKRIFFSEGYSNLDAQETLKEGGVQVTRVLLEN